MILKDMRQELGMSQQKFGDWLGGIPQRTIQNWELGTRPLTKWIEHLITDYYHHHKDEYQNSKK